MINPPAMSHPLRFLKKAPWFLLALPLFLMGFDGQKPAKTTRNLFKGDTIQATDLWSYYLKQALMDRKKKADAALKGKKFHVEGVIKMADKEWKDHAEYVLLKAHERGEFIQCHLTNEEDKVLLAGLPEDTPVIVFGTCVGYNYFIALEDYKLVTVKPLAKNKESISGKTAPAIALR